MKRIVTVCSVISMLAACQETTAPHMAAVAADAPASPVLAVAADATWSFVQGMTNVRYAHASAASLDGKVYVFGGISRQAVLSAEAYDPALDAWTSISFPAANILGAAALGSDGRIYLVGGADGGLAAMKSVNAYLPESDTWEPVADMNNNRYTHAVAVGATGLIYAIGGTVNGSEALKSAEVYDIATNSWSHIAQMQMERQAHGAAGGRDGRIYVFGGMNNSGPTATAEVYDPATDTWSFIAPLPETRYGAAVTRGRDGLLYVIGGFKDFVPQASALAYNPATDSWTRVADMSIGRYIPGAVTTADGYIYVTGGRTGGSVVLNSVERYLTEVVEDPEPENHAPIAVASFTQASACVAGSAPVTLDGAASSDPDNDPLSYQWLENDVVIATDAVAAVQLSRGTHLVGLVVSDGASSSAAVQLEIVVGDTERPVIVFNQYVTEMRPPNHAMILAAMISASDACDGTAQLGVTVSSSEPVGDEPDWEVRATSDGYQVWLRSEREGSKGGRVYTIAASATDLSRNRAYARGTVIVPTGSTKTTSGTLNKKIVRPN